MHLDPSQSQALKMMQAGHNIFLTGNAGTGKSTVICTYIATCGKRMDVTATTGVAALNLRDQFSARHAIQLATTTIYRWAGIGLGTLRGKDINETDEQGYKRLREEMRRPPFSFSRAKAFERIKKCNILVIDEISMLPGRTLQFVEYVCRKERNDPRPWGGMQVICVGDFLQLPPVSKTGIFDWAFSNPVWKFSNFVPVVLTKIHRQDDDSFKDLLNAVRIGELKKHHYDLLSTKVAIFPSNNLIRLFTHNIQVDKYNGTRLAMIEKHAQTFLMKDTGEGECNWIRNNLITPNKLELKRGARVMVTVNLASDQGDGTLMAVNGSLGTVTTLYNSGKAPWVEVLLDDGRTIIVPEFKWHVDPSRPHLGHVSQIPLRLAWATTIHKSQGLSLDSALIDARATRDPGQTYVALSRVRTLEGLHLKDVFTGVWVSQEAINFNAKITES
jgi:ATP-dependent exoDNAse (exonuclease V) alpha subunit